MKGINCFKRWLCSCSVNYSSVKCRKLFIDRSDLDLCLKEYAENCKKRRSWHLPLSLAFTLTLSLLTTEFKEAVSLPFIDGISFSGDTLGVVAWTINILLLFLAFIRLIGSFKIVSYENQVRAELHKKY